jgi:hypothetical protein
VRPSLVSVTGTTLGFDRAGRSLLAVDPDAIAVVELGTARTVRLPCADARAAIAFDDQVWIATRDDQLVRTDRGGRQLGEPLALTFAPRALFVPSSVGTAAAVWAASPALSIVDDFGCPASTEIHDVDLAIPITGRRVLVARGAKLGLPSGVTAQLAPNTVVLGGVVMADAKNATLLTVREGSRQLVVFSLGTAQVVQRCPSTSGTVRVAARGYIAVAQNDERSLVALDLRSGRELGVALVPREIGDHAIDPWGRQIAVRWTTGEIEVHELAQLVSRRAVIVVGAEPAEQPVEGPRKEDQEKEKLDHEEAEKANAENVEARAMEAPADRAFSSPAPAPTAQAPELDVEPFSCPALLALQPRARPAPIERDLARAQLDRELRSVTLWTLLAIARAWDTRRLGYGNEGRHPFELEVAALVGIGEGFASDYVVAATETLASHDDEVGADSSWRSPGTTVGDLMIEFGLDHRAIDMLLVIAAAALHGEIARLYGILANDPGRPLVDEMLVQHVLAHRHDRHDLAEELDPRAPLVRLGLVQVSPRRARPFAELALDAVVLDRLRAIAPALGRGTRIRTASSGLGQLDVPRDSLDQVTSTLARSPQDPLRLVVTGRLGSGRRTLLAALANEAGRDLAVIDARALPRHADAFVAELACSLRRAHLTGFVPCLVDLADVTFDERAATEVGAETIRAHPGPVTMIAAANSPLPFPPGHVAVELPVLPETERARVWSRVVAHRSLRDVDADLLAARYRIGPGTIRNAVAAVDRSSRDPMDAIDAYIRQTRDARLAQYARRVDRLASWSSVVLPPDVLDSLRELVSRVRHRRQVFEAWGMARTLATSRGLTALFQGQPGTGKTLVAGVVARELGLDLYQVDLSKVMSKWIGETERNLATIFDAAEDGQVILLFDEADSLFAKRTEVRSSNDRYANLEVNYLLQRLDSFEGIAILTTNIGTSIDQAFKRRMSFRLSFPFPDEETREQLWRAHLPPELPVAGPLTLDVLARKYQLSGGYIRNACLRAAFLAAQEETSLHQRHLERAVSLEFAELGKLSSSGAVD